MKFRARTIAGILLIIAGALLLLQSMDILSGTVGDIVWMVIFGFGGIAFTALYFRRKHWWPIIPGLTLLGLTAISLMETFLPDAADTYGGMVVLGSFGLSFVLVYFRDKINWWALIPGGVLITLSFITLQDEFQMLNIDSGAVFFLGLGLTFMLLFFIRTPYGRLKWAAYPGVILLLMGVFLSFSDNPEVLNALGPVMIVLAGVFILFRSLRKR